MELASPFRENRKGLFVSHWNFVTADVRLLGNRLDDRLKGFSDRQIGQLLFDFCWPELYVDGPELIIVTQAIDRLRRSTGGVITKEEAQANLTQQPVCAKCGGEMFLHCGIDEPDFWLCDCVSCRHKRYVREQGEPQMNVNVKASTW